MRLHVLSVRRYLRQPCEAGQVQAEDPGQDVRSWTYTASAARADVPVQLPRYGCLVMTVQQRMFTAPHSKLRAAGLTPRMQWEQMFQFNSPGLGAAAISLKLVHVPFSSACAWSGTTAAGSCFLQRVLWNKKPQPAHCCMMLCCAALCHYADCEKLPPPVLPFQNVSFSYSGNEEGMLYKDLEFGIDCDSRIALVGPNGAGGLGRSCGWSKSCVCASWPSVCDGCNLWATMRAGHSYACMSASVHAAALQLPI